MAKDKPQKDRKGWFVAGALLVLMLLFFGLWLGKQPQETLIEIYPERYSPDRIQSSKGGKPSPIYVQEVIHDTTWIAPDSITERARIFLMDWIGESGLIQLGWVDSLGGFHLTDYRGPTAPWIIHIDMLPGVPYVDYRSLRPPLDRKQWLHPEFEIGIAWKSHSAVSADSLTSRVIPIAAARVLVGPLRLRRARFYTGLEAGYIAEPYIAWIVRCSF